MSKIKMRCSQCGKSFKSASPKQLLCPECEEKARRAKAKATQPATGSPAPAPPRSAPIKPAPPAARPAQPKQHWLDQQQDVAVAAPESKESARPPRLEAPVRREPSGNLTAGPGSSTSGPLRPAVPAPARPAASAPIRPAMPAPAAQRGAPAPAARPAEPTRVPEKTAPARKPAGEKPAKARPAIPPAPRPKREPRPPTPPFTPTSEQIAAIEQRYQELAQPHDRDGLRSQIASEMSLPKAAVKRVITAYRERLHLPSWWELQGYHGSPDEKERIRQAYLGLLPLPPLGVHKQIAEHLNLAPGMVYQAIKTIRTELHLPQYNPPEVHGLPPTPAQPAHAPTSESQA